MAFFFKVSVQIIPHCRATHHGRAYFLSFWTDIAVCTVTPVIKSLKTDT
jgi:hypothetical protein